MTTTRCYLFLSSILFTVFATSVVHADASLASQIEQYLQQQSANKKASKFSPEDIKIMTRAATDLNNAMPNPGLKVGTKAPDFQLPNAHGEIITLSSLLAKGPVIINFYRGAWCPFCNIELRSLSSYKDKFKEYGANIVSITPQQPDKSLVQSKKGKFPFDILSDLDSSVIKKYNLFFTLPDDLVKVYKKLGLNIESFNGKGRNELPIPGTYVVDKNGVIRAAFANTDYKKRMEPKAIIEALKKL